jgi:hypothetical protein
MPNTIKVFPRVDAAIANGNRTSRVLWRVDET